jgi:formylglycine-generating enzyme required for sulfatase activity
MSAKVFISYRRDDSAGHAGRVHDRLERELGRNLLFMDVDAIPLGADFVKVLGEEVAKCDVLLAVIGPGWLDAHDEDGHRRLDSPHDYVRIEIAAALKRDIRVIPILLEGTPVPRAARLPEDLKDLALRNGLNVRHASFHSDMDRLIRSLGGGKPKQQGRGRKVPQQPTGARQQSTPKRYRVEGRIRVDARIVHGAPEGWFLPGNGTVEWFQDQDGGPEMVVVPAGEFMMGSPASEPQRESWSPGTESPQFNVTIARPFAIARHAVTRGQFAAFAKDAGHKTESGAFVWTGTELKQDPQASWRNPGFAQDDSHPVVCVNWDDAKSYVAWLSRQTERDYRLPTEGEWEYCCRAGSTTPFWWGSSITTAQANYNGDYLYEGGGSKGEWRKATVPVSEFAGNPWGLFQVHGNVWAWCEDVWHDTYDGAPMDGSAWLKAGDARFRVVRGGSWRNAPRILRSANRYKDSSDVRYNNLGFRVGRTLTP